MEKINKKNLGFGLLEVVIATGILTLVITSSLALSRMAIKSSVVSLERVQAYNLAQEGVELVREIRDSAWIDNNKDTTWNNVLGSEGNSGPYSLSNSFNHWILQLGQEEITLDSKQFKREIFIENVDPNSDVSSQLSDSGISNTNGEQLKKITVKVRWEEYNSLWTINVASYLSNWRPQF